MVRSESADEEFMLSSGKASANEEDDEYVQWTHSSRRASSSCRGLGEDDTPPNGVVCSMAGVDELSDRRIRRQIANCNERRRMQSINAGFQSLRSLLPKRDGEKMSKAAILQHTAELIQSLQAEKMRLLEEKEAAIQAKKRRIEDEDLNDRGIVDELTVALEQERRLRQLYEDQLRDKQLSHASLLSPMSSISTPATQPPSIPSPVLDSRIMRPPHDVNGLLPRAMSIDELVAGGGCGGATSPFMHLEQQASLHHAAAVHNAHQHRVSTSTTSFTCGGTAQAVVGNGVVAMDCATATNVASVATAAPQTSTAMVDGMMHQQTPLLMNSMENHSTANLSHRNLNAILEAIRHLEGGAAPVMISQSPPPPSHAASAAPPRPPTQHSNVLVR